MCTINVGDNNYCHLQKDIFYKVFINNHHYRHYFFNEFLNCCNKNNGIINHTEMKWRNGAMA